jgi:creatinine amidohydrolase
MDQRKPLYTVRGPKLLPEMTPREVAEALTHTHTVVFAAASTEAHGAPLPLAADSIEAEELLRLVSLRMAQDNYPVVAGPVIPFGPTTDRMSLPGTISLSNQTFIGVVKDVSRSLLHHGFMNFALIMYHADNLGPMMVAVRELIDEFPDGAHLILLSGHLRAGDRDLLPTLSRSKHPDMEGHGGELEASRVLAARPELVYLEYAEPSYPLRAPSYPVAHEKELLHGGGTFSPPKDYRRVAPLGYVGNPGLATKEKGEASNTAMAEWVCALLKREFLGVTRPDARA